MTLVAAFAHENGELRLFFQDHFLALWNGRVERHQFRDLPWMLLAYRDSPWTELPL